jgi:EmrB/QacA subfamily drug resistance transporter
MIYASRMSPNPKLRRPFVLACIMISSFMIAVEVTIVSTAMPQIVGHLGSLRLYSWVFASFLLTQTATTVVFGKLADLYGRKPVILAGIGIFLAGSVLCGFAWSMPSLIVFRLVQGLGAGAIQPVTLTIIGDLYPGEQRGKVQGYLASVWGLSSILGPITGGLIIQYLDWPWIFWINVPIGIVAAIGFHVFLHEDSAHQDRSVDAAGAGLFAITVAALMIALTAAGTDGPTAMIAASACAVGAVLFVLQERRARDPMIVFGLWAHRPIATVNANTLLAGVVMMGITTFLPMYVQAVLNQSALVAGFTLTAMILGWPIGSTVAAGLFGRIGLRTTLLAGAVMLPTGAAVFLFLAPGASPILAGAGSVLLGLGMGFTSVSATVIVQDSVGWAERGAATASMLFSRNLGSTLGATVLGSVLNFSLSQPGRSVTSDQIRHLLSHGAAIGDAAVRAVLGRALHITFLSIFVIAILALLMALFVPAARHLRPSGVA